LKQFKDMKTIEKENDIAKLRWHLIFNVFPSLTEETVNKILNIVKDFQNGKITLNSEIVPDSEVSFAEMCEDLKIDVSLL